MIIFSRLNLSSSSISTPQTLERGRKRKRVTLDEEVTTMDDQYKVESGSTGAVQIQETDEEGRFIKLHNMSDEVRLKPVQRYMHSNIDKTRLFWSLLTDSLMTPRAIKTLLL